MCPRRIRCPVVVPLGRQFPSRSRRRLNRHRALSTPRRRGRPRRTRRRHRAPDGLSLRSSRMNPRERQQVALGNRCRCPQLLANTNQPQPLCSHRRRRRLSPLRHPPRWHPTCPRVPLRRSCQRQVVEAGTDLVTVVLRVARMSHHPTRAARAGLATGALRTVAQAVCHPMEVLRKRRPMETVRIRPAMEVRQVVSVRIQCIPTGPRATDGTVYRMTRSIRIMANLYRSTGILMMTQPIQAGSRSRLRS
jgi:hypothetical protein